ncbi:uncharacterized protein CCOS01_04742 [Colletotrichum costaricense]|uniref:Uncharacterized protein n=1 Tax=Colletotrichum costaricense TaxID=1209916 RepID=A0AAJ0E2Z4_9PEZI|nr:uncharacterized protein CCOS01_04742 [Colletotrichum costaricense]KAK1532759.1 hypothetical protein CCOS01_04742 [Colletotrichum costaricense]
MTASTSPFYLAIRTMWPPTLLAAIFTLFVTPLEKVFYRADISIAYHIFAAASIYLTLILNVVIVMTPLKTNFQNIKKNEQVFSQIGIFNRWLVEGYLHSLFFLPNLFGPIIVCWVLFADNRYLDNLAHLYGFVVGMLHAPLLLSLAVHLVVHLVFLILRWIVAKTSWLVWTVSDYMPQHPCESTQKFLLALHVWLEELPDETAAAIDRKLFRTEWFFLQLVAGFACTSLVCMLSTMIVDTFRPCLQRLVVHITAEVLLHIGDFIFEVGRWIEGLVVRQTIWEDMNL